MGWFPGGRKCTKSVGKLEWFVKDWGQVAEHIF